MKRLLLSFLFITVPLWARDIDTDMIYLSRVKSPLYDSLANAKAAQYTQAGSVALSDNVIFAFWLNGRDILYVREFDTNNIILRRNIDSGSEGEIGRVNGVITAMQCSPNGSFAVIKVLITRKDGLPEGKRIVLLPDSGKIMTEQAASPFLDFTLGPEGESYLFEKRGIMEYWPRTGVSVSIASVADIAGVAQNGSPTMALFSPDRQNILYFSGSGGSYRGRLQGHYNREISGITSASEIMWIDNSHILCRRGYPGSYSVDVFDCSSGTFRSLASGSLHTNLYVSAPAGVVFYLMDGIITMQDSLSSLPFYTGLEGEDISLSPDRNRFLSLYGKRLFCTHRTLLEKRQLEIRRGARQILELYRDARLCRDAWESDYSGDYIARKIRRYEEITRERKDIH